MPLTGYLKIPDIAGESQQPDHKGDIEVHALDWGIEQTHSATVGRGRARVRAEMSPLMVAKYYDAASPYLAQAVKENRVFSKVVLSLSKGFDDTQPIYLVMTLETVSITSYDLGTDEIGGLSETLEMTFESITIRYIQQSDEHAAAAEHEVRLYD